jgi:flagellar hook protein FlgE
MASGAFNIAVTGMQAQSRNLEVIANNIANSQTTAFKANRMTFQEVYVSHAGVYSNGTHNQFGNGVASAGVTTDWGTGSIASTGTDSNLAITSDGFFLVYYNDTVYYTRAGDFTLCKNPNYDATVTDPTDKGYAEYVFMNSNGAVLMGGSGVNTDNTVGAINPVACTGDTVSLVGFRGTAAGDAGAPSSYTIASDGSVSCEPSDTVTVVNSKIPAQRFNNPDSLERVDGGLYLPTTDTSYNTGDGDKTDLKPTVAGQNGSGTLLQGSLEASNVDLVTEFTSMITSQRSFQANSKVITTQNELYQTVLQMM